MPSQPILCRQADFKDGIASYKCKRTWPSILCMLKIISNKAAKQGRHFAWASRGQLKMVVLSQGISFLINHHTPNRRCLFQVLVGNQPTIKAKT
jgi:hypothetical protein